jgi:hypothetical protein
VAMTISKGLIVQLSRGCAAAALLLATACSSVPSRSAPASPSASPSASPQESVDSGVSSLNLLVGMRRLDEDDWEPVDEPGVVGLEYANERPNAALGFEFGLAIAAAEEDEFVTGLGDVEFTNRALEVYGGLRKTFFADAAVRPYLGAGVTAIGVEVEGESGGVSADDDDTTFGGYAHGGLEFRITNSFRLGIDARAVFGTDVDLFGASGDVDYEQLALVAGFSI